MNQDLIMAVTALTERLVTQASHDDGLWEDLGLWPWPSWWRPSDDRSS